MYRKQILPYVFMSDLQILKLINEFKQFQLSDQ